MHKISLSQKIIIGLLGIVGIVVVYGTLALVVPKKGETVTPLVNQVAPIAKKVSPTPSPFPFPFPFQELTIPYLRSRNYVSNLSNLQKVAETQTYTSYIAQYDSDGLTIYGLLTIPKGDMPHDGWPAVVFVHGYIPPHSYQAQVNYASYVDYLAKNKLVVFKPDLRGHGKSEGEPGGTYYSADYIIDVLNARAALESSTIVNAKGIGLWGHSMAGNIIFRAFAVRPEIPAIAIWAGAVYTYSDFSEYSISDNSYQPSQVGTESRRRRQELFNTYGTFSPTSPFWQQVAGTNYISDIKGAIAVHHAVDDPVVSIDYSRNLMRILNQTAISHTLFEYDSGGHNITGTSFTTAMERTVDFFTRNLKR
ncbi:MAG: Dipeptidylaminopeptidase/acylaminoacyl-peptidase [Candidatus Gottesmanbacteria bacterium GW2011_GWA1_43_11]|uniref:Dipeptidylaminopeptidase/acylaminoacyl-peptidase n=1 Tax=Candidatus Gottesmanbacteria bacterium GW2011_GWA1_43_11 TaxID=1618436 RepID=A0A0G1CCR7_9BACT|nr:MAG: Dipeptidylaminopeptidase/acylaminoacyl-peptidase [Candidatus Gottesmanbacteria bacterium GW2011_GWA1_43_11]